MAKSLLSFVADDILKYKNLLDMGAITKEEFDEAKKKLLSQKKNSKRKK